MSKTWDIKGIRTVDNTQQTVTIATVHELEYHGEWMGDEYVNVTVKSPEPIDFHFGDHIIYRSEYFRINYDPNVVKKAKRGSYQEGFTYDNIKLYSDASKMKSIDFKDIVLSDNQISYTSMSAFSFYAGSIEDLADRLQANLDRESEGWKVYTPNRTRYLQRVGLEQDSTWADYYPSLASQQKYNEILGETDVNIDVSNDDRCWEVTKFSYEKFGLAYYMRGKNIIIGGDPVVADHIFRYGKNNGLYEIERTADENQEIVTKLFAYGSEQNLPLNYYANVCNRYKAKVVEVQSVYWQRYVIEIPYSSTYFTSRYGAFLAFNVHISGNPTNTDPLWKNDILATISGKYDGQDAPSGCCYITLNNRQSVNAPLLVGDEVYFNEGINTSNWPTDSDHLDTIENYPSLLSVNRLMLPGFPTQSLDEWVQEKIEATTGDEKAQWEALYDKYIFSTEKRDPWVMSKNSSEIGIREGLVNYDGSSQKEICPTIDNTTSNTLHSAQTIYDNGYLEEGANIQFFVAAYRGDGYLDWKMAYDTALNKDEVYIEMRSGYCTGRKFKVVKVEEYVYEADNTPLWLITCEREKDTSLDRYFPYYDNDTNWYCQVLSGDTFVVTGIQMPKEYIEAAAERLLIAACGYLDKRDHMRYTYLPKIDEIYMQRQDDSVQSGSYHDILRPGVKLQFLDADLGINRYESALAGTTAPFIDSITIKENGNNGIPTYDVVMRDEKEKGTLEKIIDRIEDLTANPPVQVVERQQRTLQTIEYSEWTQGGSYYHEDINTDTNTLEQSLVWHRNCLWMCMRTLTTDEPWFTSADWKCVRVTEITLHTTASRRMVMKRTLADSTSVVAVLGFLLMVGNYDASSEITRSQAVWTRQSKGWETDPALAAEDTIWNREHRYGDLELVLRVSDLPSNFSAVKEAQYTITVTNEWVTETAVITI